MLGILSEAVHWRTGNPSNVWILGILSEAVHWRTRNPSNVWMLDVWMLRIFAEAVTLED